MTDGQPLTMKTITKDEALTFVSGLVAMPLRQHPETPGYLLPAGTPRYVSVERDGKPWAFCQAFVSPAEVLIPDGPVYFRNAISPEDESDFIEQLQHFFQRSDGRGTLTCSRRYASPVARRTQPPYAWWETTVDLAFDSKPLAQAIKNIPPAGQEIMKRAQAFSEMVTVEDPAPTGADARVGADASTRPDTVAALNKQVKPDSTAASNTDAAHPGTADGNLPTSAAAAPGYEADAGHAGKQPLRVVRVRRWNELARTATETLRPAADGFRMGPDSDAFGCVQRVLEAEGDHASLWVLTRGNDPLGWVLIVERGKSAYTVGAAGSRTVIAPNLTAGEYLVFQVCSDLTKRHFRRWDMGGISGPLNPELHEADAFKSQFSVSKRDCGCAYQHRVHSLPWAQYQQALVPNIVSDAQHFVGDVRRPYAGRSSDPTHQWRPITDNTLRDLYERYRVIVPIEQTPAWNRFEELRGNQPWGNAVYLVNQRPRAVISLVRHRLHGIPYVWAKDGPAWIGAKPTVQEETAMLGALGRFINVRDPRSVFARVHVWYANALCAPALQFISHERTFVIDLSSGTPEGILATLLPSARRQVKRGLKQLERSGAAFVDATADGSRDFGPYYEMLADTAMRDGFRPHRQSYYEDFLEALGPDYVRLYAIEQDGRPLAWCLTTLNGTTAGTAYFGASDPDSHKVAGPSFLYFKIACELAEAGYSTLDMLGTDGPRQPELFRVGQFKTNLAQSWAPVAFSQDLPLSVPRYSALATAWRAKQTVDKTASTIRQRIRTRF